jgi:2-polyprenyl-3-methyl-5-hydroxy-6-metoxy-1,4-benzoquinol methylase
MTNNVSCPICKSKKINLSKKLLRNDYVLADCLDCTFKFASPRPTFKELANFYNSISSVRFYKHTDKEAVNDSRLLHNKIQRFHPEAKRILEIGASTGYYLHGLKLRGYEVVGSELSSDACKLAEEWYGNEMYANEFPPIEKFKEYFDVVIIHHVIEHIVNPLEFLEQASLYIAKGGCLFIETPNIKSFGIKITGKDYPVFCPPGHLNFFSLKTLANALPNKLNVIKSYTTTRGGLTPYHIANAIFAKLSLKKVIEKKVDNKKKIISKSNVSVENNRKFELLRFMYKLSNIIYLLFYPFFLLTNKIGIGENLYIIAKKS